MRGLAWVGSVLLLAGCTRPNDAFGDGGGNGASSTASPGEEGEGTRTDGADGVGTGSGSATSAATSAATSPEPSTSASDEGPTPTTGNASETTTSVETGSTSEPPPEQDCCVPTNIMGCASNPGLQEAVCLERPSCCDIEWDEACVELVQLLELDDCGVEPMQCCAPALDPGCGLGYVEECVCAIEASCCDFGWHFGCIAIAIEQCYSPCEPPSNCCFPHLGPGCDDPAVEECVCPENPACCEGGSNWGESCVIDAMACDGNPCGG